jgi:hypothetical protein
MLYGRTDIDEVTVPQPDGTSHRHQRTAKMGKGPFVLDCATCEAKLISDDPAITTRDPRGATTTTHWSPNERGVPKSEAERNAEEDAERAFAIQSGKDYADFKQWQNQQKMPAGTARRR